MGRPPRIDIPGLVYHVFNRGVKKLPIFHDDEDRLEFMDCLSELHKRYAMEIEQYSLMTNHFHFLLRLQEGSLSRAMKFLLSRYAYWFNRKNNHKGHAFQGRFGSIPVQEDRYYTTVSRYIHLNPVRAGIVQYPQEYRWSNYANLIAGRRDALASGGIVLSYFGRDPIQQRRGYQQFVEEGISQADPVEESVLGRMRAWGVLPRKLKL
jgi:REP element-mobilizing transposase RayT